MRTRLLPGIALQRIRPAIACPIHVCMAKWGGVAALLIAVTAGCSDRPTTIPTAKSPGTKTTISSDAESDNQPSQLQSAKDRPEERVAPLAPETPVTRGSDPRPLASLTGDSSDLTSAAAGEIVQASIASATESGDATMPDKPASSAAAESDASAKPGDGQQLAREPSATDKPADSSPAPTMRAPVPATSGTTVGETAVGETTSKPAGQYPDAYHALPTLIEEGPQRAVRVSFDDLDLLMIMGLDPVPADVGDSLPERIVRLDGRRIRLRGFMYPPFATEGLRGFVLARDNEICCFGRSPKIYDLVPVELRSGVTTPYIEGRPFDVIGTLHIGPEADDDELYQLFYMDDAIVIE